MVTFYKAPKKTVEKKSVKVECTDLDLQGRGVARDDRYVYFVDGLMPGDSASILVSNVKGKIASATILKITKPSANRLANDCELLDRCGGCTLAHVPSDMLVESKIKGIEKLFLKELKLQLPEISFIHQGEDKNYRRACRFAVRGDHGKLYLGFREEKSHNLVKIANCLCLTARMNSAIDGLNRLINRLEQKNSLGHVELLDSDGSLGILFRVTKALTQNDCSRICEFAEGKDYVISVVEPYKDPLLITKIENTKERFIYGSKDDLYIVSGGVKIKCKPSSFVQINKSVNEKMIKSVLEMLDAGKDKNILDLFCGLGNFTMPVAKTGANCVGIDIVSKMIEDARENAKEQGIENVRFEVADLEELFENQTWAKIPYDAVVLDPGRQGAKRACLYLSKNKVRKIVMISCNPLAASRDSLELVKAGYKITRWGVCDMFPRTTHVEMIIEFTY